jgi:hypothetical protein
LEELFEGAAFEFKALLSAESRRAVLKIPGGGGVE